jgi:hypothetical protein
MHTAVQIEGVGAQKAFIAARFRRVIGCEKAISNQLSAVSSRQKPSGALPQKSNAVICSLLAES